MFSDNLRESISRNRRTDLFQYYLLVKDRILAMIDEMETYNDAMPSSYWQEELAGFDYIFDASPLIIAKLREHCHHITGIKSYEYRDHHSHRKAQFAHKLNLLRAEDKRGRFVPESPLLGGFGYRINGALVNIDTLKFYESLIALDKARLLDQFSLKDNVRHSVLEIGAGWGGFAYQFHTLFPDVTYVIVDLPHVLLFSLLYLKALFPDASTFVYGDKPIEYVFANAYSYDFVFLPYYIFQQLELSNVDLAINIASFQEMTTGQVDTYVNKLIQLGCPYIYSMNRNRSRHNTDLTSVPAILGKYYDCKKIKVLDSMYVDFPDHDRSNGVTASLKDMIKRWKRRNKLRKKALYQYRHIIGALKYAID